MSKLEHVGIASSDPESLRVLLSDLLGLDVYKVESVASEKVRTFFLAAGGTKVELLQSDDPDSAIGRFIARFGDGLHHLAFEVDDVDAAFRRAVEIGLTPINPEPKDGADGKRIFFLHPKETFGVLIEVCQSARLPVPSERIPMPHGYLAGFDTGGPNPPLLLLHDAGASILSDFGSMISPLEARTRLIGFDAPAHGESGAWQSPGHFLRAADKHARAVLDHYDVERAWVLGVGLGGAVATSFATSYPDRATGVILVDANLLDNSEAKEQARAGLASRKQIDDDVRRTLIETLDDAAASMMPLSAFVAAGHPTLVVGTSAYGRIAARRLDAELSSSVLAILPETTSVAALVATLVIDFLQSLTE